MTYKIPTREEHNRFIRNLWKFCIGAAFAIFLITGSIMFALFLGGYDSKKIVEVSTTIFQILVLSYGMGFFVPSFLTSLFKMSLGVEMSREGLEIGQKTAATLERVDQAVESRLARMDSIFDRLEDSLKGIEEGSHPLVKRLSLDFQRAGDTIREEVAELRKALTKPIAAPAFKLKPATTGVLEGVDSSKGNGS